jgi:hypothetical protein
MVQVTRTRDIMPHLLSLDDVMLTHDAMKELGQTAPESYEIDGTRDRETIKGNQSEYVDFCQHLVYDVDSPVGTMSLVPAPQVPLGA